MTDKTELEVTQADREAAWPHRPSCYKVDDYSDWMAGKYDLAATVIKGFARHRLTTRTPDPTPVVPDDGLVEALERIAAPAIVSLDQCPAPDQPNGWRHLAVDRIDIARNALAAYRGEA